MTNRHTDHAKSITHRACDAALYDARLITARRYASAVYAVAVCPSVCLSVTSRQCIETIGRIELVFDMGLPSTYPTLCFKESWVSPKIRVGLLPAGTLFQTSDFKIKISPRQVDCVVNNSSSSMVEFVDDTYMTIDESWLFTTIRSTVTL